MGGEKLVSEPIVPYLTLTCDNSNNRSHALHQGNEKQKHSATLYKILFT